jgi:hypothetical protein
MKKYRVIITEEYSDIWDVGAESRDDAKKLARKLTRELNGDKGRNPDAIRVYSVKEVSGKLSEDCYTEVPERDERGVRNW